MKDQIGHKHKYVRMDGNVGFILFPADTELYHAHVGQIASRATWENPLSAGFAEITNGKVTCFGRSESMCLGGLPDDSEALQLQLFGRLEKK